jgi:hypothetical protein
MQPEAGTAWLRLARTAEIDDPIAIVVAGWISAKRRRIRGAGVAAERDARTPICGDRMVWIRGGIDQHEAETRAVRRARPRRVIVVFKVANRLPLRAQEDDVIAAVREEIAGLILPENGEAAAVALLDCGVAENRDSR